MANEECVKRMINASKIESIVGRKLASLYSGYEWYVECVWETGVLSVRNLTLGGEYGFIIHLHELVRDVPLNGVMKAGGEILERCGLPATHRPSNFEELVTRDFQGNVIGDLYGAT